MADLNFVTDKIQVDIADDGYSALGRSTVYWNLDIDVREWGIKELMPIVTRVHFPYEIEYDSGRAGIEEVDFDITDDSEFQIKTEIDTSSVIGGSLGMVPVFVYAEMARKEITISFRV